MHHSSSSSSSSSSSNLIPSARPLPALTSCYCAYAPSVLRLFAWPQFHLPYPDRGDQPRVCAAGQGLSLASRALIGSRDADDEGDGEKSYARLLPSLTCTTDTQC
jgi:hypothetical protein